MEQSKIIFITLISIISFFILLLLIYFLVYFFNVRTFKSSVVYSVQNENYCIEDEGECRLLLLDLPIPELTDFNETALFSADLISRVSLLFREKHSIDKLEMPNGLTNLKTLYFDNNIFGFVAKSDDTYWIAFRGTSTSREWTKDFQHSQQVFIETKSQRDFLETNKCHSGFVDIFDSVIDDIKSVIPEKATIVITGHSLGASIAGLTCLSLVNTHNIHGYMFGSPRICDVFPTDSMKSYFRINNTCDPIKEFPLSVMWNMKDKKKLDYYTHGGIEVTFTDNRQSLTNNHLMPTYINALKQKKIIFHDKNL
jgi:hypothetical protein